MNAAVIWENHCRHMALQCRAWGMDEAARMWTLAADAWRALDEMTVKLEKMGRVNDD
jgi:hypothetical protein